MRRIRNSVKALIVSLCLVVILAGSIIGVVLAARNKGKDGDPTNPNNPVEPGFKYELTEDQKALVESINKNASTSVEIATEFNPSDYVTKNGDKYEQIDLSLINKVDGDILLVTDSIGSTYYVKRETLGNVYYQDICDIICDDGEIVNKRILSYNDNCLAVMYVFIRNNEYNLCAAIVDLTDYSIEKKFVLENLGDDYFQHELFFDVDIMLCDNLYYFYIPKVIDGITYREVYISSYSENPVSKTFLIKKNFEIDSYTVDKHFILVDENKYIFGYFNGLEILSYEFNLTDFNQPYFCENFVFIEYAHIVDNLLDRKDTTFEGVDYSYSCVDMLTGEMTEYSLDDGYARAYFDTHIDGYYGIFTHKTNENNEIVDGLFKYYKLDGTEIVKYGAKSNDDRIIAFSDENILTRNGIFTSDKSVEMISILEFSTEKFNYFLNPVENYSKIINNKTIVVVKPDSNEYRIVDINGKFVFEEKFSKIYSYGEGYYFVEIESKNYIANVNTKTLIEVENFSNKNIFIYNGGGLYLVENDGKINIYNFKGDLEFLDVDNIKYKTISGKTYLNFKDNKNIEKAYYIDKLVDLASLPQEVVTYVFEPYKNTIAHSGSSSDVSYSYSYSGRDWTMSLSAPKGYVLSESTNSNFQIDRNNGNDSANLKVYTTRTSTWKDSNEYLEWGDISSGPGESFSTDHYNYTISGSTWAWNGWYDLVGGCEGDELNFINLYKQKITMSVGYGNLEFSDGTHNATWDGDSHPSSGSYDESITVNSVSRLGYDFTGWTYSHSYVSGSGGAYKLNPIQLYDSVTFYANWTAKTYTVTYSYSVDDGINSTSDWAVADSHTSYTVSSSSQTISPKNSDSKTPYRTCYTFTGWTITTNCSANANSETASASGNTITIPAGCYGNMTVQANWSENTYHISFVFGELSSSPASAANVFLISQFGTDKTGYTTEYTNGQITQGALNAKYIVSNSITYESNPETANSTVEITHKVAFKYTETTTLYVNSGLYNWGDVEACGTSPASFVDFNPARDSCKFSVYNAPLQLEGWAYSYGADGSGNKKYHFIRDGGTTTVLQYLVDNNKYDINNNGGKDDGGTYYDIVLYAVYKPKEYKAYYEVEYDNGQGSLKNEGNNDKVNFIHQEHELLIGSDLNKDNGNGGDFTLDGTTKFYKPETISSENIFNVFSSNNPMFKIATNWGEDYYYDFDKIVISNFGYKISDTEYGYATIEIVKNENGFQKPVVTSIKKQNSLTGSAVTIPALTEITHDGKKYYHIGNNQANINGFRLEMAKTTGSGSNVADAVEGTYNACNLYFYNVGYAGDHTTDSHEITQASVTGKGTYGFTIKVYLKSNYTDTDKIKIDGATNTTDTKAEKDSSSLLMTNVTGVYQDYIYNPHSRENVLVNYFWLNGKRVALVDADSKTTLKSGYYSIKYNEKFGVYYNEGGTIKFSPYFDKTIRTREFECYTAEYLREPVETNYPYALDEFGERKDIIYMQYVNYDSTKKGNVYYMGGQDPWPASRPTIEGQTLNYTNFNSSQLLAITPEQQKIKISSTVNVSSNTSRYELINYLSKLKIGTTEISFGYDDDASKGITKVVAKEGDEYYYGDFNKIIVGSYGSYLTNAGLAISKKPGKNTQFYYYAYMGFEYDIKQAYQINIGTGVSARTYILYFGVRSENTESNVNADAGYDYSDNYVMYFLYSNVGKNNHTYEITAYFTDFDKRVTTFVEDSEKNYNKQLYSSSPAVDDRTADVQYGYFTDLNQIEFIDVAHGLLYSTSYTKNEKISYYDNINPSDLIVVRITPKDGFILESVKLIMKNSKSNALGTGVPQNLTLFDFSLGNISLNVARGGTPDREHAFVSTVGGSLSYMYEYNNAANSSQGSSFYSFDNGEGSFFGIYCANREDAAVDEYSWKKTLSAFESIYFLIGGIYHDIDIEVKTASYIEFNFEGTTREETEHLLGFAKDRYNESDGNYTFNANGEYILNLQDITSLNLDPVTNSVNVKLNSDYYEFQSKLIYYYDESTSSYKKVHKNNKSVLTNNEIKKFLIDKSANASTYTYMAKQSAYESVYLKELTHLSILVRDSGNDWVKLGNDFGVYDSTLVKRLGFGGAYFFRIIFIGKSRMFGDEYDESGNLIKSGGVKIFASGEDYSLYFTNGKFANDNLSAANGIREDETVVEGDKIKGNGLTAFQLLSDIEGRQEDVVLSEENSISLNPYTPLDFSIESGHFKNIKYTNYLTYMQIDNIESFFAESAYDRDGSVCGTKTGTYRYEFARKYYFSVKIHKNEITMNVNSYIQNNNLGKEGVKPGHEVSQIEYGSGSAYNFATGVSPITIYSDNRAVNNELDSTSNNGLKFKGLTYSDLTPTGFAYSVTDAIDAVKTGLEDSKTALADYKITAFNAKSKIVSPYMWLAGNTLYQLDYVNKKEGFTYAKKQSWFNDTILTNIDYTFKNDGNSTTLNWQDTTKNYGENMGNADPNHKVSGYGISYTYRSIPGYYLQYIVVETVEYGILYLNVNTLLTTAVSKAEGYLNSETAGDGSSVRRLYYYLERRTNTDGTYEYFLKFYKDADVNNNAGMNSLGILSNNISVSFYSNARSIEINYHENNDSDNISSIDSTYINDSDRKQEIYYDNLTVLDPIATMPGYTFIGWASEDIVSASKVSSKRFDPTNLTWATDSAWMSVVGNNYNTILSGDSPDQSHDYNYVNYFSHENRDKLLQLGKQSYGYDFYVKSSVEQRKETTGYFITDTGSVASENYNFWSVYANMFTDPANENLGIKTSCPLMTENFVVNLYAIWKANVYSVEINMNDVNEANGSTTASMAFGRNQNGLTHFNDMRWDGYIHNEAVYGVSLNNKAYANQITAGTPVAEVDKDKNIYYCYVTFDKNDWYIVSAQEVKSQVNNAAYSIKGSATTPFVYKRDESSNRLDFIIDRYGYSWLGWFAEKYEAVYQGYYGNRNTTFQDYYNNDGLVFGSDYFYYINEYSSVRESGYERTMPYLRFYGYSSLTESYIRLNNFDKISDSYSLTTSDNGTPENSDDDYSYYEASASGEIYSEFVYKNEYFFKNRGKSYVYHYDYKTGDMSIYDDYDTESEFKYVLYRNKDYLNGVYNSDTPSYVHLNTSGFNQNNYGVIKDGAALVYFDTSLTLASYDGNDEGVTGVENLGNDASVNVLRIIYENGKTNYRYLTIYAHWSTNNYKVTIDYRDETSKSIENLGSTDVTNSTVHGATGNDALENIEYTDSSETNVNQVKTMNSTFFDDDFFDYILKKSIPIRVGYDFLGWSFFYRDPARDAADSSQLENLCLSTELIKRNGELYKYNGYTYVSPSGYTLNGALSGTSATIYNNYYSGNDIDGDGYIDDDDMQRLAALYTAGSIDMIDSQLGTVSKYDVLSENLETFGDADVIKFGESDDVDRHFIYIFAMWRAQTYTINVGLNIDTHNRTEDLDDLANVYDHDSGYSIGFYDSYNNANEPQGWVGVNSLFLRQKGNENNIYGGDTGDSFESMNNYSNVYSEIVSNMTFVITFDELFSTAKFVDPNNSSRYYKIEDLFAVSAGHYLLGWLYTSTDKNAKLIADEFCTTFGYNSNLVKIGDELNRLSNTILADENNDDQEDKFDETWHGKLKNSNYKNINDISDANTFENNNTKNLNDNDQSGASSAFGYVVVDSKNYYIQTEYIDSNSDYKTDSHYLTLSYDGKTYYVAFYQNGTNNILLNDFNYLYYKPAGGASKYIVRFYEKTPGNIVAYYVPNTSYAGMVELDLSVAVFESRDSMSSSNLANHIQQQNINLVKKDGSPFKQAEFLLHTTRQFSIYALWDTREDLSFTFTNGNNGEYDEANLLKSNISNPGLAGFVSFYNENKGTGATTPDIQTWNDSVDVGGGNMLAGEDVKNLSTNFTFYDDVGFDLLPFFNGRFISKLYLDFDRIESNHQADAATSHTLVRYRLELTFNWVNANKPEDNNVRVTSLSLKRLKVDDNGEFIEDVTRAASPVKTITNDPSGRIVIQIDDSEGNAANALALRSYLSILDNDSFTSKIVGSNQNEGLFTITKYGQNPDRSGNPDSKYGRRDINMLSFDLDDLISSAQVTCFYSVQTYKLTINHIFDESGDTLDQDTIDSSKYTSQFTELEFNQENSLESDKVYSDVTPTGDNQKLATIPINLINNATATSFNVPYGYFIYGTFYSSELVGFRPMDDYYLPNMDANYGGDTRHSFDGFDYLYQKANYTKGQGGSSELLLDGNGVDLYYDQGSPILGSASTFPLKSVRYSKSFYLFKGWFEDSNTRVGDFIVFDAYDVDDEASYIDRNITLYGYYYSNNTPTNIQFYTWNNDWNENSAAYVPYSNNKEEYTLSSSEENSPYTVTDGYLTPVNGAPNLVDDEGRAVFKSRVEFGVDSSGFSNDKFNSEEIAQTDVSLLNNILKTYWYYDETYTVRYANVDGIGKVYVKFDNEIRSEYTYVASVSTEFSAVPHDGMIVHTEEYEKYVEGTYGLTAGDVPVLAWIDYDTGSNIATIVDGGDEVEVIYEINHDKFYFRNPDDGLVYLFSDVANNTVINKFISDKDVFYIEYEDGGLVRRKVKVMSSADMSSASIRLWDDSLNGGLGDYSATSISLSIEELYVYGDSFIGAELYAVIGNGDQSKYYKYRRIEELAKDLGYVNMNGEADVDAYFAASTEFIKNNKPRYYVEIGGIRYFTFITKTPANNGGAFTGLYKEDGEPYNISFNITTLNNYYVLYEGVYYEIEYEKKRDLLNVTSSVYSDSISYVFNPETGIIVKYQSNGSTETQTNYARVDFDTNKVKILSNNQEMPLTHNVAGGTYSFVYMGTTYTFGDIQSVYVNPLINANTVQFVRDGVLKTFYFNYEVNSRTSGLYEDVLVEPGNVTFSNQVLFAYNIYTPINQNYTLKAALSDGKWEAADITLNAFPSINMDYWYNNPDYVLLGYINVSETDIAAMKRSDDSNTVTVSKYMFVKDLNAIVVEEEYKGGGSYTTFATLESGEVRLHPGTANEKVVPYSYDASKQMYYFFYTPYGESDSNLQGYYYFSIAADNTIEIYQELSGGQVFTSFSKYIADIYPGDAKLDLRLALERAISGKILNEFSFAHMIKSPMFVESYQLSTKDYKTIEAVTMRITCQFVFTHEELEQAGLLAYCGDGGDLTLAINIGTAADPEYKLTISTTYSYTFNLISTKTLISANIWALPVYVPDVIKFVGQEFGYDPDSGEEIVLDNGCVVNISGTNITFDYMKMDVSHFDLETFRKYGSDHIWNQSELTPEMIKNADYLQFVMLNSAQYQQLLQSTIGCDVTLNGLITKNDLLMTNDLNVKSLTDAALTYDDGVVTAAEITFNLTGCLDGDYYIFGFYYTIDTLNNVPQYVFNTKIENVMIESVLTYEELKAEFDPLDSGLSEEELIALAEAEMTGEGSSIHKYGTLSGIRYNKHINRVSDNILKVSVVGGVVDSFTVIDNPKAQ